MLNKSNLDSLLQIARMSGVPEKKIEAIFKKHNVPIKSEKVELKKSCIPAEKILHPGCIVEFEKYDDRLLGIILSQGTIVYFNGDGVIKGYINNATIDSPYKILRVLEPTDDFYKLSQYDTMPIIWQRPTEVKIKKSVSDIERELGLAPGTLEIC